MKNFSHEEYRNEDEIDASGFYLAGYRDPSSVGGVPTDPRVYTKEPALDSRLEIADEPRELVYDQRHRSHFQPAVKVKRDYRSKWLKAGDLIAFLFLAFGFGLMLVYFGAFRVIGAVIHEVMQ